MSTSKHLHQIAQPIFTTEVYIFHQDHILMFKRSEDKKKFPGFWSIPGGHIEAGEDPLAAAIREVREETGVEINADHIKLKVVALHHHLDREELYVAFSFVAELSSMVEPVNNSEEGTAHWLTRAEAMAQANVFPPIKYYFDHVLNNKPGIIYNQSQWQNNQLIKVLSETVDRNG